MFLGLTNTKIRNNLKLLPLLFYQALQFWGNIYVCHTSFWKINRTRNPSPL